MNIPVIYAQTIEGEIFDDGTPITMLHRFYLDGEAEEINGNDICFGNIHAISMCLHSNIFDAVLVFWDGSKKGCKVWSYYNEGNGKMSGYVWLNDDETIQPIIQIELSNMTKIEKDYFVDNKGIIHFNHERKTRS